MKRKIILILCVAAMMLTGCVTGCAEHTADQVEIYNKSSTAFDNINIPLKEGYFYVKHEKFTVDENTLGITIYFSNDAEAGWE